MKIAICQKNKIKFHYSRSLTNNLNSIKIMQIVRFYIVLITIISFENIPLWSQTPASGSSNDKNFYKKQMILLQRAIETNFYVASTGFYKETIVTDKNKNAYSYLWPLCGMIQANNEIEKVNKSEGLVQKILNIIQYYYDSSSPAPGYASYIMKFKGGDRFYDDNQWIGIACMDAYFRLHSKSYLNTAKEIYRYMITGYDTILTGGLYWQENKKTSKNTCSNGPGIILALQLFKTTKTKTYLDTALLLYNWVNSKLHAPSGLYYDNINCKTNKIGRQVFSYNTGTMLQSNVYLYEITHDKEYLKKAISIADSSLSFFYSNGKFRDSYWFNAVLLRSYQHLLQYNDDTKYILAFKKCLDNALHNDKSDDGLMGKDKDLDLTAQAGMLEILARFAWLETRYQL